MKLKTVPLHKYQARFHLSNVPKSTIGGMCIHTALKKNMDLDELIGQLRSQSKDAPERMRTLLGDETFEKLILQ
jgi:hypothetical protein